MALEDIRRWSGQVGITIVAAATLALLLLPARPPAGEGLALLLDRAGIAGSMLAAILSCALALLVAWRLPRHPATPSVGLCFALAALCFAGSRALPEPATAELLGLERKQVIAFLYLLAVLVCAGLARLSVLFPRPVTRSELETVVAARRWRHRPRSQRNRWYDRLDRALSRAVMACLSPRERRRWLRRMIVREAGMMQPKWTGSLLGLPWTAWGLGVPFALLGLGAMMLGPRSLAPLIILLAAGLPIVLLAHAGVYFQLAFRLMDDADRRKALWVFAGFLWLFGTFMLMGVVGFATDLAMMAERAPGEPPPSTRLILPTVSLGWVVLVLCFAIAIFRDGLLDPALVIRRATLYGALAALLSLVFAVLEVAATRLLTLQFLGLSDFGPAVAALGVGLTARPLHGWLTRTLRAWLDRVVPPSALAEGQRTTRVVVFSDLSGYTKLTATDERSALTLASLFHKKARRLAERHGGRVVKTIGDAVLIEFADVPAALQACLALPAELAAAAELLELPPAVIRTGMHRGEVVRAPDGDLYGSTVNLAARLQGGAAPGELIASREIVDGGAAGRWRFEPLGARQFKNVPAPVDCFRVLPA